MAVSMARVQEFLVARRGDWASVQRDWASVQRDWGELCGEETLPCPTRLRLQSA
ncbi:hypothetical protein [Deinococcus sp.]|uniref:hypothetical protein n=1 Tax=Deinococcus sp. TaxID=47478 RepID=UPI0025E88079|nr:hypothetical protein [Deinococcus sp.]